jgi:BirA family biotin operon repressor/biotin-[acetyl-CoA-carboxylase] ligase
MSLVIHRLVQAASTQEEARRLADAGSVGPGHVILADEQTTGRGRFGRSWLSPGGGLYATFIVPMHPMISIVSAIAVLRVLSEFGVQATLKWPNDLLIEGRKLGGFLIEAIDDIALVGIGINLTEVPLETATSVRAVGGRVRRGELVVAIGERLHTAGGEDVLTAYRENLSTLGRTVKVTLEDGETIEGTAADVDPMGRLLLETAAGLRTIASGECVHLRS